MFFLLREIFLTKISEIKPKQQLPMLKGISSSNQSNMIFLSVEETQYISFLKERKKKCFSIRNFDLCC